MIPIKSLMHFSIAVSDMDRSVKFYSEVLGFKHLATTPTKHLSFLDAAGTCILLHKQDAPINPRLWDGHGYHHAFVVDEKDYDTRTGMEWIGSDIPRADARWIGSLLSQLSHQQLVDAFRSGQFPADEIQSFVEIIETRIRQLAAL